MTSVALRHVGKVFPDGFRAVRDVDLTIHDRELFVLVGPSGCGKTTVLRMVAGLEEPTAGDIEFDGVSVRDLATRRRDVAMLFQSSAVYPHLDVRSNLGFPLRMAGVSRAEIERRVADVAGRLGLTELLGVSPRRLSGGQRQRVAMGRAMIRGPSVLLMDEPMSGLDAKLRTELRSELAATVRELGVTTLLVTHDQVEAMALGHRIAVMRSGRVAQCGPPAELYDHPADLFVAQFLGSPPMNAFRATVERDGNRYSAVSGGHRIPLADVPVRWPAVAGLVGGEVAVGIRPHALTVADDGELTVEIAHVEPLGADRLAAATFDGRPVSQSGDAVELGEPGSRRLAVFVPAPVVADIWKPVHLRVDPAGLHLFDVTSGVTLAAGRPGRGGGPGT